MVLTFFCATFLFTLGTPRCSDVHAKKTLSGNTLLHTKSASRHNDDTILVGTSRSTQPQTSKLDQAYRTFFVEHSVGHYERALSTLFDIADELKNVNAGGTVAALPDEIVSLVMESPLATRMITQPNGHAGDYGTIEALVYGENTAPIGTFGRVMEEMMLKSPMAQQHRNKVKHQAQLIDEAVSGKKHGIAQVLSIACGGNADIRSLDLTKLKSTQASFTMVDFDDEAIQFSMAELQSIASQCTFVKANVLKIAHHKSPLATLPRDVILVGGLFDYLPERFIVKLLSYLWSKALAPGGALLFTNVGHDYPSKNFMDYVLNWTLISRSEQDLRVMCLNAGIPDDCIRISPEETGITYIVKVEKPTV